MAALDVDKLADQLAQQTTHASDISQSPVDVNALADTLSENGDHTTNHTSMIGSLLLGGKIGVEDALAGIKQHLLKINDAEQQYFPELSKAMNHQSAADFTKAYNKKLASDAKYQQSQEQHPYATAIGETLGSVAPFAAVPEEDIASGLGELASKAGAPTLLAKAASQVPTGGLIGATQYDPTGGKDILQNAVGGALGGASIPVAGALLSKAASPVGREMVALGETLGQKIPIYPGLEKKLSEMIPGSGITKRLRETGANLTHGAKKYAQDIIGEFEEAHPSETSGSVLRDAIQKTFNKNNSALSQRYQNELYPLALKTGKISPLNHYKEALSSFITDESAKSPELQNTELLNEANKRLAEAHQFGITNPYQSSLHSGLSYPEVHTLAKQIGSDVGALGSKQKFGGVNVSQELGLKKQLYGSLQSDMDDFARDAGSPELRALHNQLSQDYKDKILPFKGGPFTGMLDNQYDTDKVIGKFLAPNKMWRASKLINFLPEGDKKSLNAARAAILDHAMQSATTEGSGVNGKKFVNNALRLGKVNKILFTPEQHKVLKGYQSTINYLEKYFRGISNQSYEPTAGSMRHLWYGGMIGSTIYHPALLLPILGSGFGVSRLLGTRAGQSLMKHVERVGATASEKEMAHVSKRALDIIFSSIGAHQAKNLQGII